MNNKGFAITTILYGTLILFSLLLVSMLGILSTYRGNLEKLIDNDNAARDIVTMTSQNESSYNGCRGLYCGEDGCEYKTSTGDCFEKTESDESTDNEEENDNVDTPNTSKPEFTYTGNSELIEEENGNWKIKFLSSGDLTVNQDISVEVFLVGAGGAGVCGTMSNYDTNTCPGGGGGYHEVFDTSISSGTTYTITVGQANGGKTVAFDVEAKGGGSGSVGSSNGYTGSGGSACYEFEEETGDILYSGRHSVSKETPPANTGRGGVNSGTWYGSVSGSSGIVIIRNVR